MFESEEQKKRAELIITLLAKLYVVLELSVDSCPVCHRAMSHDSECPISLAWTMRPGPQHRERRIPGRPHGTLKSATIRHQRCKRADLIICAFCCFLCFFVLLWPGD
jgi:hypothetical protein